MLVSILIPCFNAERWIAQAIESALSQTWIDKEVIVVDDGSTDRSLEIIKAFGDRIRWENGPNRGANVARNRLLDLSRGEWLQYLDADDYLLPDKIAAQMDFLAMRPESDVLYSPVLLNFCSTQGSKLVPNPYPINTDDIWIGLVRWHTPQTGGFLYRRQAMVDAGGWNPAQPCCQDNEMTLRLLMHGRSFVFCPSVGAVYRLWSHDTVSRRNFDLVRRNRLKIIQTAEIFLRQIDRLTPTRQWAVNQARFEVARSYWPEDPNVALDIVREICELHPGFRPGAPVPIGYRACYRLFGFRMTEKIAAWQRQRPLLARLRSLQLSR